MRDTDSRNGSESDRLQAIEARLREIEGAATREREAKHRIAIETSAQWFGAFKAVAILQLILAIGLLVSKVR